MDNLDLETEQACLGLSIRCALRRFTGRRVDEALVAEMADVLNRELVSFRAGRRIELVLDGAGIRVELTPEPTTGQTAAASAGLDAVAAALAA